MEFDPHEPGIRALAFRKKTADEVYLAKLNEVLQSADLPDEDETKDSQYPLVYIVGAPRSGTTLLSQMLSRYLPVGYINNVVARFWMRPSVGIRLSGMLLGDDYRRNISFRSNFGTTEGAHEPHEFGYFWRHWLKLDQFPTHKIPEEHLGELDAEGLRKVLIHEILGQFRRPVVFKNVICGLQARYLTEIYGKSIFIHIKRDPFMTAASILKSRRERFGSYSTWWSLKPSTWPFAGHGPDPVHDVSMQVFECRREIDEELKGVHVNSLQITYEQLCSEPSSTLSSICCGLDRLGCTISPTENSIDRLDRSVNVDLPDDMIAALRVAVTKIFSGRGRL